MGSECGNPLYNEAPGWRPGGWREMPQIIHNKTKIHGFFGDYRWLSNFGRAQIELDGVIYSSVEIAYQAAKWNPGDREFFAVCSNEEAIGYNRAHQPNRFTPDQWDELKLEIMRFLLKQKFNPQLNLENYQKLLATGERDLAETNWWNDTFWGVDLKGNGQNWLGRLLMECREELSAGSVNSRQDTDSTID